MTNLPNTFRRVPSTRMRRFFLLDCCAADDGKLAVRVRAIIPRGVSEFMRSRDAQQRRVVVLSQREIVLRDYLQTVDLYFAAGINERVDSCDGLLSEEKIICHGLHEMR